MSRFLRVAPLLLLIPLLPGCQAVVMDRAKLEADLPLASPAMLPDSARPGSVHLAAALRVSDGMAGTDGDAADWKLSPIGGAGQVQVVASPGLRLVAGAGYGGSPSAWTGLVLATRSRRVGLDVELLAGTTQGRYRLDGHVKDLDAEWAEDNTLHVDGTDWHSWGQGAVRLQAVKSGPWIECRVLPWFPVGTIRDPKGRVFSTTVRWTVSSLALGWTQQTSSGDLFTAGVRTVSIDGSMPNLQLVASLQHPVW